MKCVGSVVALLIIAPASGVVGKQSKDAQSITTDLRGFASAASQKAREEIMATLGSWRQGFTNSLAWESSNKNMAQLVAGTHADRIPASASPWKRVALPQLFAASNTADTPVLPLGVGAHLSGKAVAQRTVDSRKECEDKKWPECFSTGGDYSDHVAPNVEAPAPHSSAPRLAEVSGLLATIL